MYQIKRNTFFLGACLATFIASPVFAKELSIGNADSDLGKLAFSGWLRANIQDKDYSDEILTALFKEHTIAALTICNMVTDLDNEAMMQQAKESQTKFLNILKTVLIVNESYFKPKIEKPKMGQKKEADSDSTWFDSFQFLISAGHHHQDIMNMTYGAYERYLNAATKDYQSKLQYLTVAIRSAHHADASDFKKFFEGLKS